MGLVRLRGWEPGAPNSRFVGGNAASAAARATAKPCIRCAFAGCPDIGYGAPHAFAPSPRAGAPHVKGSSLGETKSPSNRRTDRAFDRASRHVSPHGLRIRRSEERRVGKEGRCRLAGV